MWPPNSQGGTEWHKGSKLRAWIAWFRDCELRPFFGLTLVLAVFYAPIVTYILWLHSKTYAGPLWLLVSPVLAAILSGYADHKLSAFRCAVLLTVAAYAITVADSVREFTAGSPWYEIPMTALFAAIWFSTAIFVSTMALVMFGRVLWILFRKG